MTTSQIKIFVHLTWCTKGKQPMLTPAMRASLKQYLKIKSKEQNMQFKEINVQPEHVHALIELPLNQSLSDFMRNVKGGSSIWLNKRHHFLGGFHWSKGYGAFSVSSSQVPKVREYIRNQDRHHLTWSYEEEFEVWKREYGLGKKKANRLTA